MKATVTSMSTIATVALAATVCLSACGSSSHSGAGGTTTSDTGSISATTPASLSAIHAVVIDDSGANAEDPTGYAAIGIKVAVEAINAAGGVKGHPLDITVCSTQGSSNIAGQCARSAAADQANVALVGTWSQGGDQINPIVEQAKMANIGVFPQAQSDYSGTTNFPVSSGTVGIVGGMVILASNQLKAKDLGVAYADDEAGAGVTKLLAPIVSAVGAKITQTTAIPISVGDVTSNVADVTSGTQAVLLSTGPDQSAALIRTAKSAGINTPFVAPANIPAATLQSLPSQGAGLYMSDSFLRSGAGYSAYKAAMTKYGQASLIGSLLTLNSWVSVQALVAACDNAPTINRASVLTAISSMTTFTSGGLTPSVDFTKPSTAFAGAFPRLFNGTATFEKVGSGGNINPLSSQFYDVFGQQ
jgi:branched-chain amino acid transport system substrate-binding protein